MKRLVGTLAVVPLALALLAVPGTAGPEKIAFPKDWKSHTLYITIDRYDIKQHRELYGTPEAIEAVREGRPIPSGSVLTLVQFKAQLDAAGNPIKDAAGRFVKGDMVGITVMEKRTGWGAEYPTGPVAMKSGANDVNIAGFAFGPKTLVAGPGQTVTWTNADDSPHQITLTRSQERSPVLLKGQSHAQAFAAPGLYDYICGLHPGMKGAIEVK